MGDNILRLESVEFEGWSASRIGGNFGVDPRTLLYGDDSDALCEIVDAIRRGLGIVEETRDGVYPRLESVEFEDRARVGFAASSTAPRERSFTAATGTRFAKSSACFVAGSESSKKHWTAIIRGWKASSSRAGARIGFAATSTAPRERSFTTSPRTPFAKSSARFVAGSNRQRNVGATETDLSGDWARRFVSPAVVLFVLKPFPANSKSV